MTVILSKEDMKKLDEVVKITINIMKDVDNDDFHTRAKITTLNSKNPKFKKGDLVEVLKERVFCYGSPDKPLDLDNKAIIDGSYADLYGGNDMSRYSVIFVESGGSYAWVDENDLKLVDEF